jgi:hypothetical protein
VRGFEIDDRLKVRRLFDRNVSGYAVSRPGHPPGYG